MRLGPRSRRFHLIGLTNDKIINLQDFLVFINLGVFSSNGRIRKELVTQPATNFHSSCQSQAKAKKSQEDWRREFLLKKLDKLKREKVEVWRNMSVHELATKIQKKPKELLEILHNFIPEGHFYRSKDDLINDPKILVDVVRFMKMSPMILPSKEDDSKREDQDAYPRPAADPKDLVKRPPIVTIMGHVDHGKTTLLDYLRSANVVSGEFGGITQHIGAFSVKVGNDDSVTFIDTPGHAAFTSMRSRGAHATDIVVLVVAADDGVMEQTVESIRMAQEAAAPIIVAINKIDKPEANIKRTEEMLAQHQLYTESMGGDVQAVPISALNGTNVDTLVEAILLQSEIMQLKGDPSGLVEGVIVESKQDSNKGKLATAIIHRGTLRKGAFLVAGTAFAKVRLMFDESGKQITQAPPSTPVEMMGWRDVPAAGEVLLEVESEKRAQQVITFRKSREDINKAVEDQKVVSEKMKEHRKVYIAKRRAAYERGVHRIVEKREKMYVDDNTPRVKVIIKGDVDGSVEAILDVLETYDSTDVPLSIVHYGVGDTSQGDLDMASLFGAIIYCFNVKTPAQIKSEAKKKGVEIRHLNVIYHLVDDVKRELSSKMPTTEEEEILGEADVIQQFDVTEKRKKMVVAGLRVTKGEIIKAENVKLVRNNEVLYSGPIYSLRHLKNEVNSMKNGQECGLMLQDSTIPVKLGDVIICFKTKLVQRPVDWDPGF